MTDRMAARGGPPGTGQRIHSVEQAWAKQLLPAHVRAVTAAHRRASSTDGPVR
ncbi:hypothetical protein ACN263_12920 [Micromonospora sp. WMMD729]|uniref:hypothetical protein n=1 Tax=Micromonospora sp. WMMD729 TaxID=3404127 RepID=UPI003BF5DD60